MSIRTDGRRPTITTYDLARLRAGAFGASNGGWAYDAYPELETLDAGAAITIADIEGPAVITCLHCTQHFLLGPRGEEAARRALAARGVVLEVFFNGAPDPAVCVPLGDFFADGCGGRAVHFTTPFVEKAPESYNCFVPMPFARSARVVLRNDTPFDLPSYSFVEFERLPEWQPDLGYLHATWRRAAFQLDAESDEPFFHADGRGHLVGRAWSVATDDPFFAGFWYVMEGNNELRVDGEARPAADYLGTEDSFGFSWGFQRPFTGLYNGINFVQNSGPALLSLYRFRDRNAVRFSRSLDLRVDWTNEFRSERFQRAIRPFMPGREFLPRPRAEGRGWVDYATTFYWYQQHVGHPHDPLPPLDERAADVLHPNPLT